MTQPFDFATARRASEEAARSQEGAEEELRLANATYAAAEESYRKALAAEEWRLRREAKVAWSALPDLARGAEQVAQLKRRRDEADGMQRIAAHAVYRRSADRRDTERFIDWSARRDLAEGAGRIPEPARDPEPRS